MGYVYARLKTIRTAGLSLTLSIAAITATITGASASPAPVDGSNSLTSSQAAALAKAYLEARSTQLVAAPTAGAAVSPPLGPSLAITAAKTDQFLRHEQQLLLRHRQRFIASDVAILQPVLERQADNSVQLSFTEYTRWFFDLKLDPEAPVTTEQRVERIAAFHNDGTGWKVQDVRRASNAQTTPMNDAPGQVLDTPLVVVSEAADSDHSPMIDTPLYNYGIETLSADDRAEDQQPDPPDTATDPATAPEDGTPNEEPDKADGSGAMGVTAGYCYTCMVNYAKRWWWTRNPAYRSFGNDCTNFVSQSLKAGGWAYDYGWYRSGSNWWYNSLNQTYTWAAAENWSYFAPKRTRWLSSVWYLLASDVLLADWNRDGNISHAMLVTKKTSSMVYITQHTDNYVDRPLSLVISGNPGTWFYAART